MRSATYTVLFAFLGLIAGGCDSGPETATEMLAGTWKPWYVGDVRGNLTSAWESETDETTFLFRSNDEFRITVDYNAAAEALGYTDVTLTGKYSVSRNLRRLTLDFSGSTPTLEASGNFAGPNVFNWSAPAAEFNALFGGSPKQGVVEVGLERQ